MPRFAANLSMLFTERPFLERFDAAAAAGFEAVEFLFPYDFEVSDLRDRLIANGLSMALHNLPAGDWAKGERGIACHPDRLEEFEEGVSRAVDYAQALGCRQVNCLAGIAPVGVTQRTLRDALVRNLAFAAGRLKEAGIRLLVEPINTRDIPGFFLTGTRQALEVIAETGSDSVFLQYDAYHMQVMEGDLAPTLERHLDRIAHVQVADTPGRNEPGTGEINYPFLFDHLDRIGYRGWVGCEYRPRTTTEAGLGWFAPYRAR